MTRSPMGDAPPPVGACRVCAGVSWHGDDAGPVHLCCARWEAAGSGGPCGACAQSRENARAQRQRRRPVLVAWPNHDRHQPQRRIPTRAAGTAHPDGGEEERRATT